MEHDIQNIDFAEIERQARIARAEVAKAGFIAFKSALKSVFTGQFFAGAKTA